MDLWRSWHFNQTNIEWDVANFYSYLPAKFCNNHSYEFGNGVENFLTVSPKGETIPKMTYGMALMYSPFFAMGYLKAIKYSINKRTNIFSLSKIISFECFQIAGLTL